MSRFRCWKGKGESVVGGARHRTLGLKRISSPESCLKHRFHVGTATSRAVVRGPKSHVHVCRELVGPERGVDLEWPPSVKLTALWVSLLTAGVKI